MPITYVLGGGGGRHRDRARRSSRQRWAIAVGVLAAAVLAPATAASAQAVALTTSACEKVVSFGLIEAKTDGCLTRVTALPGYQTTWESTDTVAVNGITLSVASTTRLMLSSKATGAGHLSVQLAQPVVAAGVTWLAATNSIGWNLPAGSKGEVKPVAQAAVATQTMLGFPIAGMGTISIGWDDNSHYVRFAANLALTGFKTGPKAGAPTLTAAAQLRYDAEGAHTDLVKVRVQHAYAGPLEIKQLCLSYIGAGVTSETPCSPLEGDPDKGATCASPIGANRWDGNAQVVLPTADGPELGVFAGMYDQKLAYAGASVTGLGNSLPLAEGVFLDSFGLNLCLTPKVTFGGTAGINFGPTVKGITPLTVSGALQYRSETGGRWSITTTGKGSVFGKQLATMTWSYRSDDTIRVTGSAELTFPLGTVKGTLDGALQAGKPVRYSLAGSGKVCFLTTACANAEIVVSSRGVAGCFTLIEASLPKMTKGPGWGWNALKNIKFGLSSRRVRTGLGYLWSTGQARRLGDSCDIGDYAAPITAQSDRTHTVTVAASTPALSLRITGETAAPVVKITSPAGTEFTTRSGTAIQPSLHRAFATDAAAKVTEVQIGGPAAGVWKVEPLAGSTISEVQRASAEPPPSILGDVAPAVQGNRYKRKLYYIYLPQPGHTITLVEQGTGYERQIGMAAGKPCALDMDSDLKCGEVGFEPDPLGTQQRRTVVAVVRDEDGLITRRVTLDTFMTPKLPQPQAVAGLKATRTTVDLATVEWNAAQDTVEEARPVKYDVRADIGDSRHLLYVVDASTCEVTSKCRLRIPDLRGRSVVVTVTGLSGDEVASPARSVSLPVP